MAPSFRVEIQMACSEETPEVVGRYSTRGEAVAALKAALPKWMNDDDHLGWTFSIGPEEQELPDLCSIYNDFGELASDIFGLIIEERGMPLSQDRGLADGEQEAIDHQERMITALEKDYTGEVRRGH